MGVWSDPRDNMEITKEFFEEENRMSDQRVFVNPPQTIIDGRKDDQEKVRWDLLPGDALNEIAKVLTFGAVKYGDRNWEKGMAWHRPFGALMRHMWDWWRGAPPDPETGLSHLAHAGCCLLFLLSYELRKTGQDDRHLL